MKKVTEASLLIDKYELDRMVIEHSELFFYAATQYVECIAIRDKLKDALNLICAEQSMHFRQVALNEGAKLTEAALNEKTSLDTNVLIQQELYQEAKKDADLALALKDAFQQRGYVLKELVTLYGAGYFISGSERPQATDAILEKRKTISKRIKSIG